MSKMGSHDPFGHLKHNLWPKERSRVKLAVEKLGIDRIPWHATCHWKALDEDYNFALDLIPIGSLQKKLSPRKVA
jgi:hypothetical protein